jgi:hypothetical protein
VCCSERCTSVVVMLAVEYCSARHMQVAVVMLAVEYCSARRTSVVVVMTVAVLMLELTAVNVH